MYGMWDWSATRAFKEWYTSFLAKRILTISPFIKCLAKCWRINQWFLLNNKTILLLWMKFTVTYKNAYTGKNLKRVLRLSTVLLLFNQHIEFWWCASQGLLIICMNKYHTLINMILAFNMQYTRPAPCKMDIHSSLNKMISYCIQ